MSIYASTKALFGVAMTQLLEAQRDGDGAKIIRLRDTLEEVFNNTVDSNETMLTKIHELEDKLKASA